MSASITVRKRLSPQFTLDASFAAPPGFTVLFGASGSGKTTVLRAIAGLTTPDAGRIVVDDRIYFDDAQRVDLPAPRRATGYVFQQLALFPHLTVRGNIAYGLHRLDPAERRERVDGIAGSFRIAHVLERKPDYISGGERQRTALARALVTQPRILLLDEPLSALDHATQSHIIEDLRRWNERHAIPVLYVTHGHREVYSLADRVVVLEQGRVVHSGTAHDVLDRPGQRVLASLAGFENVFEATVVDRQEAAGTMRCRVAGTETELEVPLAHQPIGEALSVAIRAGDILVAVQQPHGISARNVFPGRVAAVTAEGPTIVLAVDTGARFVVHLTRGAATSLGIRAGDQVWLIVKTYSCRVLAGK
jgi:molybdate transport system ATP-binding protein